MALFWPAEAVFTFTAWDMPKTGWSHMFWPTPGREILQSMLNFASSSQLPMPETMSSCGDWKTPAERMASFLAVRVKFRDGVPNVPAVMALTPVAVVSLNVISVASVCGHTIGAWRAFNASRNKEDSDDCLCASPSLAAV